MQQVRTKPGTVAALILDFEQSPEWKAYDPATRNQRRGVYDDIRDGIGDKPAATITRKEIEAYLPTKARDQHRKSLKVLFRYAIENDWREDNPTAGIKPVKAAREGGFPIWSEAQIEQFYVRHGEGSKARLAIDLFLYTEQRISDVVRMGWWCVIDGVLRIAQKKGKGRSKIASELDPYLLDQLEKHCPKDEPTFLLTEFGNPFTSGTSLGNWFRDRVKEAGLTGVSAHGLRKRALTRFAVEGASAHMLMARGGIGSLQHVMTYTKTADRERLAREALKLVTKPKEPLWKFIPNLGVALVENPAAKHWSESEVVGGTGPTDPSAVKGLDSHTLSFVGRLLLELAAAPLADKTNVSLDTVVSTNITAPVECRDGDAFSCQGKMEVQVGAHPAQAYAETGRICKRREGAA